MTVPRVARTMFPQSPGCARISSTAPAARRNQPTASGAVALASTTEYGARWRGLEAGGQLAGGPVMTAERMDCSGAGRVPSQSQAVRR
jgi:hypothetical protein